MWFLSWVKKYITRITWEKTKKFTFELVFVIACLLVLLNLWVVGSASGYIYTDIAELPGERQAVLILGAKVYPDRLSNVLRQRVEQWTKVYTADKAEKILISGDHGQTGYDEVNSMREYILKTYPEVEEEDIFMDHAGFDTYDSVYRAKHIFEVKSLVIVTQWFHVYRAVYMARAMGIDAVGIALPEDDFSRRNIMVWNIRESIARSKSFFDTLLNVGSKYLGKTIPITGDGRESWD